MTDAMPMTGVQRAAVVLLSLGEAQAAEVLKHMGAKEVQKLGVAMTSVGGVNRDAVARVFDEFVDVAQTPQLRPPTGAAHQFPVSEHAVGLLPQQEAQLNNP